jgi:hypothetical protein
MLSCAVVSLVVLLFCAHICGWHPWCSAAAVAHYILLALLHARSAGRCIPVKCSLGRGWEILATGGECRLMLRDLNIGSAAVAGPRVTPEATHAAAAAALLSMS